MIDLLLELTRNTGAKAEDFVLVIGTAHRNWFMSRVLPIMEYERSRDAPDQINGVKLVWTDEFPSMFLFVERNRVNLEDE